MAREICPNPEGWNYDIYYADMLALRAAYSTGYRTPETKKAASLYMHYRRQVRLKEAGEEFSFSKKKPYRTYTKEKLCRIPEGYIVVPKEPSAELVNHGHQVFLGHFNEGGQTGGRSLYFAYKAMIEAAQRANQ